MAYFEDDTVSVMCPGKKYYKKNGKSKTKCRILLDSLKNLYQRFILENDCILSYTTFTRLQPFWVTFPTSKDRDTCACIIHSNTNIIILGLKNIGGVKFKNGKEALE